MIQVNFASRGQSFPTMLADRFFSFVRGALILIIDTKYMDDNNKRHTAILRRL